MENKTKSLYLRFTVAERKKIEQLADDANLNTSVYLYTLIKAELKEKFGK